MSDSDSRSKWDARYRDAQPGKGRVAEVLLQNRELIPSTGKALDLACGLGANALYLAQRGLQVHAWDISSVAIERLQVTAQEQGLELDTQCRDIVAHPPPAESFDLIVVSRFLERSICPAIAAALKPGGLLFYQTYTKQRVAGPSSPRFLLDQGELLQRFSGLEAVRYREGEEARFVGRKRDAGR